MRVFVTGATGFVGSAVVDDLVAAGHQVVGLSRSDKGDKQLKAAGAEFHRGDIYDLESLRTGTLGVDGVIHTAFDHDFSKFKASCETDRGVITTLGEAIGNSGRPFIITSGIGVLGQGAVLTEQNTPVVDSSVMPRVATEEAAAATLEQGVNVSLVRLPPSTHGEGDHGFVPLLINLAIEKKLSAYIGDGHNRWPAVHRRDAARVYRLALERGVKGNRYHPVAETGVPFRDIATIIGEQLHLPVASKAGDAAAEHFTWFIKFASMDIPASAEWTKQQLGWKPEFPGLLEDLVTAGYFSPAAGQS